MKRLVRFFNQLIQDWKDRHAPRVITVFRSGNLRVDRMIFYEEAIGEQYYITDGTYGFTTGEPPKPSDYTPEGIRKLLAEYMIEKRESESE